MNETENISWRPEVRVVRPPSDSFDEVIRWIPGYHQEPGERWTTERELSLLERLRMWYFVQDEMQIKRFFRNSDVYSIMHAEDLFKAVLHLPKPLAVMLDDERVPRTKTVYHFIPLVGPYPLFVGPLKPYPVLRRVVPRTTPASEGFAVQPMSDPVRSLPLFPSPAAWAKSLSLMLDAVPKQASS